jgi:hypothetical protein
LEEEKQLASNNVLIVVVSHTSVPIGQIGGNDYCPGSTFTHFIVAITNAALDF